MTSPVEPVFAVGEGNQTDTQGLFGRSPQALHCHRTGKLLEDPVVGLDGYTYERSVIEKEFDSVELYSNRAIKSILQRHHERSSTRPPNESDGSTKSLREALQATKFSSRQLFKQKQLSEQIPESFFCPIMMQLMTRPVIDPAGHSYEHAAIVAWIRQHHSSPVTRQTLAEVDLRDNLALTQLMEEELGDAPQHGNASSIRQWQENRTKIEQQQGEAPEQALPTGQDIPMTFEEWERRAQQQRNEMEEGTCWDVLICCLIFLALPILLVYYSIMFVAFTITFCFCPGCIEKSLLLLWPICLRRKR